MTGRAGDLRCVPALPDADDRAAGRRNLVCAHVDDVTSIAAAGHDPADAGQVNGLRHPRLVGAGIDAVACTPQYGRAKRPAEPLPKRPFRNGNKIQI